MTFWVTNLHQGATTDSFRESELLQTSQSTEGCRVNSQDKN